MYNRKRNYTIILVSLFLASGCVFVFFSHKSEIAYTFIPLIVMVISAGAIYYIWQDWPIVAKIPSGLKNLSFWAISFCIYTLITTLQKGYVKYQLNRNSIIVNGIVIENSNFYVYRQGFHSSAEIEYRYNGSDYRQSIGDDYHTYKYHDHVQIKCSTTDPEIFKIVGHTPGLNIKY